MTFLKNLKSFPSEMAAKIQELISAKKKMLEEVVEKFENFEKTNYDLGLYHLQRGNLGDALMRFKIVNIMNNNLENRFQLIRTYILKKDFREAQMLLEGLENKKNILSECDERRFSNFKKIVEKQEVVSENIEEFSDIKFLK